MKNKIIVILFILFTSTIYSQIEDTPKEYSKIYFTYTKKSNYYFTDKGIYADTLLLKIDLPNKKFTLTKFPNNDSITAGFIPIDELTKNDNAILSNSASRNFSTTEVVFDVKKREATITKNFTDNSLIPKDFFDFLINKPIQFKPVPSFITYKESNQYLVENSIENTLDSYDKNTIKWIEGYDNVGLFEYKEMNILMKNLIFVDPKLSKYIVPTILFSNCEYGITKVVSIPFTVELIKVSYK